MNTLAGKLRRARAELRYVPRTLGLLWEGSRGWCVASAALLCVQGLLPLATVYLTRALVDRLVAAVKAPGSWQTAMPALTVVLCFALLALIGEALRGAAAWVRAQQSELLQDHIYGLIHRKSAEVDLAFYDSPKFYDQLHRARSEASYRPLAVVDTLGGLAQNAITLAAMVAVLARFGAWLPFALFASTIPAIAVVLLFALRSHDLRLRTTADERKTWYYDWLLTSRDAASELRLFGLAGRFEASHRGLRRRLREARIGLARSQSLAELAAGLAALGITGASMAWMVFRAVRGAVTLGDLALFYQAFQQGLRLMRALLDNLGQLYRNTLFLGSLFEFLDLEPRIATPAVPVAVPAALASGVRFRKVTFRYPGADRPTLCDFNLEIPAGRVVALVGPNGAGKSTLVKLLCRFYDPESGCIEMDGVNLREFGVDELRARITVLFQDPVRYNTTFSENVALGNAARDADRREITAAAEAAGAGQIAAGLPHGYDHLLGREFVDGAELSAGQWQRVALARAFLRQAPLIVLDEPTSAMDPWAEHDWLERFRALAAGRTALIITHRFTTAMRADFIHVVSEGEVVESGSHDALVARGGLYAQSWANQMSCA